ncbi:hypothetical protein [Marimonas lutisalis]|uniref:hypothetical protein n=1 Tax=Marimonas lutisalis TaxID=2545756 RepID=UPI0010F79BD8|nr:hypothetical protein [Marimonas lutisalis]
MSDAENVKARSTWRLDCRRSPQREGGLRLGEIGTTQMAGLVKTAAYLKNDRRMREWMLCERKLRLQKSAPSAVRSFEPIAANGG